MFTLITDTEEYTLNTIAEVVDKANTLAQGTMTSFDLECLEGSIYFGFSTEGHLTTKQMREWLEEELERE